MAESQPQTNGLAAQSTNGHHQSPEPQHEQPDPVDSSEPLENYNWDDLEARFHSKMEECDRREQGIEEGFQELLDVRPFMHVSP